MYLSNLRIANFRNFETVDIPLDGNIVLLGENRVGKSNLLFAIRLVIDPTLPDSARQLKLSDFWDGCDLSTSPQIEIHLEFADFDSDASLSALLTDFRIAENPALARLSYVFRKKEDIAGEPKSSEDCEFIVFGGGQEQRTIPSRVRRRIAIDMLDALRDAEAQLASWRNSPLRPLLEDAFGSLSRADLDRVASALESATGTMEAFTPIKNLEESLRGGILNLAGTAHDLNARLRFAPTDPLRLMRSISMFIDDGKRGITEASLGSANVALISLKLAEFAWRRAKNERNFSLLCIEEPEAHLHPQLQRAVFDKLFNNADKAQSLIVTSHSPTLASIAPLRSVVRLCRDDSGRTHAFSLAELPVTTDELDDIERYLTATRAELLFAKGVIFVEGDAEEVLIPGFAEAMGLNLDELGITVCSVAGVNFEPYVKLAGSLGIRMAVITDWDPLDGSKQPLGKARAISIWDAFCAVRPESYKLSAEWKAWFVDKGFEECSDVWKKVGIFLSPQTFEVSVANTPILKDALLNILDAQGFGSLRSSRIASWRAGQDPDPGQLLAMISDIGKGRMAAKLKKKAIGLAPPEYIAAAIQYVVSNV
ncbi:MULTISPECIES: ATP-dependent nuclease [Enterobacter]|uniref:ATP-dependent nuclease n=3 Tax=unclassified Enterobacter cloacae complex TaxID=2757714 RepID=A0A221ZNL9_9ENTR|nr:MULTISPECIES: AAA family ATPase [Enterobacter]ASO64044.1 ATP-dependent nuclease [Enterobacter cloacae complex sp. N14-2105]ASO64071.1 ATP-dependent nuclease [Enterobacter cloacae complex sp. N15-1236]ASO64097.1 ATP-dependent nuclease [Enterobacter cloacae complex sp. N15-1237]AMJ69936.1 ATP-dependent endonuclease [Enterobacter cloacae]AOW71255.1 endonuclease [Enterobacter cloacae]